MNKISLNLASLIFIRMEPGGVALFVDGEGDEIRFYVNGQPADIEAAIGEIGKAMKAAVGSKTGYYPDSETDPRD